MKNRTDTSSSERLTDEGRELVDMSPQAISRRIRDLSELHKLGMAMKRVRWPGKVGEKREWEGMVDGPGGHG